MNKAFTLLELVFVIAVVGILAAIIIPSTRANPLREAAIQVVSHIRYTQHLAMVDDKFAINDANWYKKRWQIFFTRTDDNCDNEPSYTIFADTSKTGNPDYGEIAKDSLNSDKLLSGGVSGLNNLDIRHPELFIGNKKLNIGKSYGISKIDFSLECSFSKSRRISFDHLGRPLKGSLASYDQPYKKNRLINDTCNITLSNSEGNVTIAIEPETGYAHILL